MIVEFCVLLAEGPFGISPSFGPDAVTRVVPSLDLSEGGVLP